VYHLTAEASLKLRRFGPMNSPNETIPTPTASDFLLSNPPVEKTRLVDKDEAANLSLRLRSNGGPIVCALARNSNSLFAYWEIDWPVVFRRTAPRRREVYLRLQKSDGAEISSTLIEPMAGQCEISVPNSNSAYRVEVGYFGVDEVWHSVGSAQVVSTPPDSLSEPAAATFATVPFHLSFQRLTDLFQASGAGDGPVIEQLGRIQEKASMPGGGESLTSAEGEILRAVDASLPNGWQDAARNPGREIDLEQRLTEILGFGTTSPTNSFGGTSRGS